MARTVLHDVSDMIDGGVRAFLSVTKRLPVDFPEERVSKDEVDHLANMGKRTVRRPVEEDIADDDLAALAQRKMLARQRRRLLREHKSDTADRILESIERRPGVAKLRNAAVVELGHQDVIVS